MKAELLTISPLAEVVAKGGIPEWGRWQTVEHLYGIKRSTAYQLLKEGRIKAVSLRKPGNVRGCRLFFLPSIDANLRSLLN